MSQKASGTASAEVTFKECPLLGQATQKNCNQCMYQSLLKRTRRPCIYGETNLEEFARHRNVPADQVKFQLQEAQANIQRCILLHRYLEWVDDITSSEGLIVKATEGQWARVMEKLPVLNIAGMGIAPRTWIFGYKAALWKRYQQQYDVQVSYTLDQLYGLLPVALQALQWARSRYVKTKSPNQA